MNNPDRVELGSEEQVRDGKSGGAPEWLRPAFHIGGRAFLGLLAVGGVDKLINAAVTELQDHPSAYTQKLSLTETIEFLTKGITSAEAAELCTGSVLSLGFKVVDHPTLGREKITDPTDFALGAANFTEVQAYDQEGAKRLAELARLPKDDPDRIDLTNRPKPITSDNMVNRGMYSHATVTFEDEKSARECNTKDENGHPALKVWLHFPAPKPEDDDFATYPAIISKGKTRIHVAGRVESRVDELNKIADDKTLQILPVGMWVDRAVKELRGYQLNSFKAPSGTAEIISETNRQLIREQVKTLLKQKEEADKAKKAEEEDKSLSWRKG
ncbi:hypothetical protein HYT18_00080 [Candidatus Microgenomates bacterium]|nr:hypothetical protein [Candidatus Microgenomates bacterium]